jgi:hypothetical protein
MCGIAGIINYGDLSKTGGLPRKMLKVMLPVCVLQRTEKMQVRNAGLKQGLLRTLLIQL